MVKEYVNWIESPFTTLIAEKTLWSHITGRRVYASVPPGVEPMTPVVVTIQPEAAENESVSTDVVFDVMSA